MVYAIFSASVLLAIGAIYAGAVSWLYFRQERLLFEPDLLPHDDPICTDPDTREFFVDVPGARLSVAHMMRPDPRGVFFFLHGNSGNLKKWFVELDAFRQANFDVVMFDYRGFGKSSGQIESEEQLHADVAAVWAHFAPAYEGKRVVISGQSLGTGLAAGLAARLCSEGHAPDLTLLVSPYSSMRALAAELYPTDPDPPQRDAVQVDAIRGTGAGRRRGARRRASVPQRAQGAGLGPRPALTGPSPHEIRPASGRDAAFPHAIRSTVAEQSR
ncbi:MAG: hypothetical protein K0S57_842 [Ramlibacter sp.]|nr:hypothetical protein [Ramlibacter sp.]